VSQRLLETRRYIAELRVCAAARPPSLLEPETWAAPTSPGDHWVQLALECVQSLARSRASFTIEDVRPLAPAPPDARAWGAVLTRAARNGWIRADAWVNGGPARHSRPIREWTSNLYDKAA